jgi:hypothetical protein
LQTLAKNKVQFEVPELVNGKLYTFRIIAFDTTGNESAASSLSATPSDTQPPAKPKNLSGAAGNKLVNLFWSANTEPDLKGYYIYRNGSRLAITMNKDIYRSIGSLTNGANYEFEVSAVDYSGNESPRSNKITLTPDLSADSTPPATPTGLQATGQKTTIQASWEANAEPDLIGYFIYLDGQRTNYAPISANAFSVSNLLKGKTYSVAVSAMDNSGNESARSDPLSVYVDVVPMPDNLQANKVSTGGVKLTWTDTNPEPDKYLIYRNGIPMAETTTPQYLDNTVVFGNGYKYQVSGERNEVESDRANAKIYYSEKVIDFGDNDGGGSGSGASVIDAIQTGLNFAKKYGTYILLILGLILSPTIISFLIWMMRGFPKAPPQKKKRKQAAESKPKGTKSKTVSQNNKADRPRRDDLTVDKRLETLDKQGRKAEYNELMGRVQRQVDAQVKESYALGEKGRRTGRDVSAEYAAMRKRHHAERGSLAREVREQTRSERESRSGRSGRGQRNGR